jgi:hypothetical protein
MRFFIVFYLAIHNVWASHYGTGYSSSGHYSQSSYSSNNYANNNSSTGMSLNLPRIDIRIEKFISTPREMERREKENGTEEEIEIEWYKRDKDGELVKGKNFQNHVLKILIEELTERFSKSETNRSESVESILLYLNQFIGERFIPVAYQPAIKKIFNRAQDLQNKPALQVTNIVFKELTEAAQKAFRAGKRVQASGIERSQSVRDTMQADPLLVELLFMQLVWDAQKRNSTRQELLNTIEKNMVKMEQLFGSDPAYTIVGTFSSLRATLLEKAQQESPFPALLKYIIGMMTEGKKELEEEHEQLLANQDQDDWEEIIKEKAEPAVSVWVKKEVAPKKSEEEEQKELKRKKKKKKKLVEKEQLENIKETAVDSVKNKGIKVAQDKFSSLIGDVFGSLGSIGG